MSYQVTAPLVLAKDREGHVHHVYEGGVIEWLSDEQAEHLLAAKMVVKFGGDQPAADADDQDDDDGLEKPKQAAPKAAWVDYAVNGAPEDERISEEEAEALSKAALIERFG